MSSRATGRTSTRRSANPSSSRRASGSSSTVAATCRSAPRWRPSAGVSSSIKRCVRGGGRSCASALPSALSREPRPSRPANPPPPARPVLVNGALPRQTARRSAKVERLPQELEIRPSTRRVDVRPKRNDAGREQPRARTATSLVAGRSCRRYWSFAACRARAPFASRRSGTRRRYSSTGRGGGSIPFPDDDDGNRSGATRSIAPIVHTTPRPANPRVIPFPGGPPARRRRGRRSKIVSHRDRTDICGRPRAFRLQGAETLACAARSFRHAPAFPSRDRTRASARRLDPVADLCFITNASRMIASTSRPFAGARVPSPRHHAMPPRGEREGAPGRVRSLVYVTYGRHRRRRASSADSPPRPRHPNGQCGSARSRDTSPACPVTALPEGSRPRDRRRRGCPASARGR